MMELVVHAWPGPVPVLRDGLFVIGVETSALRERAREQVRLAARTALAAVLDEDASAVTIASTPGQPPHVSIDSSARTIGCSFAHEDGYALAAFNLNGAVGVDLMRVQDIPDWQAVAHDYLGAEATAALQATEAKQLPQDFARAWVRHEALLKCAGRQLSEWAGAPPVAAIAHLDLQSPDSVALVAYIPKPG